MQNFLSQESRPLDIELKNIDPSKLVVFVIQDPKDKRRSTGNLVVAYKGKYTLSTFPATPNSGKLLEHLITFALKRFNLNLTENNLSTALRIIAHAGITFRSMQINKQSGVVGKWLGKALEPDIKLNCSMVTTVAYFLKGLAYRISLKDAIVKDKDDFINLLLVEDGYKIVAVKYQNEERLVLHLDETNQYLLNLNASPENIAYLNRVMLSFSKQKTFLTKANILEEAFENSFFNALSKKTRNMLAFRPAYFMEHNNGTITISHRPFLSNESLYQNEEIILTLVNLFQRLGVGA